MADTNADPLIGCQINHYVIGRRLGQGGMGVVYQGRHMTLERDVAIKFLPANLLANADYVERFFREARAAAHLNHPNIISVQDAGTEDTVCYFVMEYVEGRDLAQLLKEHNQFSEGDAIRYGIKVANAMAYAHKANIIHRDIKPENLFLSNSGELKVGDLGLAKQTDEQGASLTMSGVVVGTPYYISPEQIRGAKDLDARNFKGAYGNTALLQSLGQGQLAAAELLIGRGADCNTRNDRGETALTLAQQKGCNKIVEALQKAGAMPGATAGKSVDARTKDASGKAALLNAVGTGNLEAIPALAKGQDAETLAQALKLAVTAGSIEPIKVLIAAGANPNTKFYKNWTPFLFAVQAGHTDVIHLLLRSSADANAKTDDGWTPLILAIRSGRNENVQLLATSGADLNLKGVGDNTPLMDAVSQGQLVAAEYLIRKRASVNAKNSRGETALILAQQRGHAKIVDLLKQAGAKE